jgi:hypothetical protein
MYRSFQVLGGIAAIVLVVVTSAAQAEVLAPGILYKYGPTSAEYPPTGKDWYADSVQGSFGAGKLTDGIIDHGATGGTGAAWDDPNWTETGNGTGYYVGLRGTGTPVVVTFQLSTTANVSGISIQYVEANLSSVTASFSTDNVHYNNSVTANFLSTSNQQYDTLTITPPMGTVAAKYVQLSFTGASEWAGFVSEVTFSTVPEPSTFTLLGIGLTGLLAYVWRKIK